jgi:hypothetical protein
MDMKNITIKHPAEMLRWMALCGFASENTAQDIIKQTKQELSVSDRTNDPNSREMARKYYTTLGYKFPEADNYFISVTFHTSTKVVDNTNRYGIRGRDVFRNAVRRKGGFLWDMRITFRIDEEYTNSGYGCNKSYKLKNTGHQEWRLNFEDLKKFFLTMQDAMKPNVRELAHCEARRTALHRKADELMTQEAKAVTKTLTKYLSNNEEFRYDREYSVGHNGHRVEVEEGVRTEHNAGELEHIVTDLSKPLPKPKAEMRYDVNLKNLSKDALEAIVKIMHGDADKWNEIDPSRIRKSARILREIAEEDTKAIVLDDLLA